MVICCTLAINGYCICNSSPISCKTDGPVLWVGWVAVEGGQLKAGYTFCHNCLEQL